MNEKRKSQSLSLDLGLSFYGVDMTTMAYLDRTLKLMVLLNIPYLVMPKKDYKNLKLDLKLT